MSPVNIHHEAGGGAKGVLTGRDISVIKVNNSSIAALTCKSLANTAPWTYCNF